MQAMNNFICSVCGAPIKMKYYGLSCCRACSAFYRRTKTLNLEYNCRFNGSCDVTYNMRQSCRYCRYQKCLKMMETELTLHNIQKKVEQSDEKQYFPSTSSFSTADLISDEFDIEAVMKMMPSHTIHQKIQEVLKARIEKLFQRKESILDNEQIFAHSVLQQGMMALNELRNRWPQSNIENVREVDPDVGLDMDIFARTYYAQYEYGAHFCMHFEEFAHLPSDQKWIVYKNFAVRFHDMERAFTTSQILGYDLDDNRLVSYHGFIFSLDTPFTNLSVISNVSENEFKEFINTMVKRMKKIYTDPLKKLRANEYEFVYILISILFGFTRASLRDVTDETMEVAERVKWTIGDELHQYYLNELKLDNYADRIHRIANIIASSDTLDDFRQENMHICSTFNMVKGDIFLADLNRK